MITARSEFTLNSTSNLMVTVGLTECKAILCLRNIRRSCAVSQNAFGQGFQILFQPLSVKLVTV